MMKNLFLSHLLRVCGNTFCSLSNRLCPPQPVIEPVTEPQEDRSPAAGSTLVEKAGERSLYRTGFGDLFWLNDGSCIDKSIIETGAWEPKATEAVRKLVKKGDVVFDVGANIGYFTVLLAKLVGPEGRVYAFEPIDRYYKTLEMNLRANGLDNCRIFQLGLSNKKQSLEIFIDDASATIHVPQGLALGERQTIDLTTLNDFVRENGVNKIDFIKIDVDGHEPLFFEGAWEAIDACEPIILTEVSQLHFLEAGFTAWEFYRQLCDKGYKVYSEAGLVEFENRSAFLIECGNYAYSANVFLSKREL